MVSFEGFVSSPLDEFQGRGRSGATISCLCGLYFTAGCGRMKCCREGREDDKMQDGGRVEVKVKKKY